MHPPVTQFTLANGKTGEVEVLDMTGPRRS